MNAAYRCLFLNLLDHCFNLKSNCRCSHETIILMGSNFISEPLIMLLKIILYKGF